MTAVRYTESIMGLETALEELTMATGFGIEECGWRKPVYCNPV